MVNETLLKQGLERLDISLTGNQLAQLKQYAALLVEWNEKMNLTAIKDPDGIAVRHFEDSLTLCKAVDFSKGARLIDVGTGAGFPAIPVKIARPDLQVTLLDGLNKRLVFLQEVCKTLNLPCETVHARAEDGGRNPEYRERYDAATARAVAHLRELAEYCLPYVRVGGVFAAMKSGEVEPELREANKAISMLGGEIMEIKRYELTDSSKRSIVLIRKISHTSTQYPRSGSKIAKKPLL